MPSLVFGQSRVATPAFSVGGGEYTAVVLVTVRVATPGATIRFTQNGVDPTETDPVIVSGSTIAINTSQTLKARAWKAGWQPSGVRSATYRMVPQHAGPPIGPGSVAAGRVQTIVARPDGHVFAWDADSAALLVAPLPPIVAVAAGANHALALTKDGDVYAWGANDAGQLGDGTLIRRKWPVRVPGLSQVVSIAAGRRHSVALTADGQVLAFGGNGRGQLGTSAVTTSRIPIPIAGLSDVIDIEAGDEFSVAVTAAGGLFAWGANNHAQLGDGSRLDRDRPVRIAIDDVIAVAAGGRHGLALSRDGSVYAWGAGGRGQLGTGTTSIALTPRRLPDLLAYAVSAGRNFSAAVRRDGALAMWGANESGQLGDGTQIDRPRPVVVSGITGISALSLGVRHAVAATASGTVWTWGGSALPSTMLTGLPDWGPPIGTPAEVPAPTIHPPAAAYPAPQSVTIAGPAATIVRYTIDGSDPIGTSTIYTGPFTVATTTTVKARAFSAEGRLESAVATHLLTIDLSPPSIAIEVSPPLTAEWMTTPLRVSFTCSDDSGSVSCPPAAIIGEGAAQLVRGIATDPAGNRTAAEITVNVDLTAPEITVAPFSEPTTDSAVLVDGTASDAASGLAGRLACNGEPVEIVLGRFTCAVSLRPGINTVTLQAADTAGHLAAAGLTITRIGQSNTLAIAPESRTMLVGEAATLTLHDDYGAAITGAEWSASDAGIVTLSHDDPPVVSATSPGAVTITASKHGLLADATVVVQAGIELAPGTIRWRVAPSVPGHTMRDPMFTRRVDGTVPAMFVVETDASGDTVMRATTADGEVQWMQHSPGIPLMGDEFGGVIAGVPYDVGYTEEFRALVRLGSAGGVRPWRYDSLGSLLRPAQSPDGSLHAIEYVLGLDSGGEEIWDKHLVVIDGTNGKLLRRSPVARETRAFTSALDGQVIGVSPRIFCRSTFGEEVPPTTGPVIGSDGHAYYLVRRRTYHSWDTCVQQLRPRRAIDLGIDVVDMSADPPAIRALHAEHCDVESGPFITLCDGPFSITNLMPDGIGGLLASWTRTAAVISVSLVRTERVLTRWDETGARTDRSGGAAFEPDFVGQDGILYRGAHTAFDLATGEQRWSHDYKHLLAMAATPDGGIAMLEPARAVLHITNAQGEIASSHPFPLNGFAVHAFDQWVGVRDGQTVAVAGRLDDATRWRVGGNLQLQGRPANPGQGIFLKSHWAFEGLSTFKHHSIRIVPADQALWRATDPSGFLPRDVFGNHFMTLGAGTGAGDTAIACRGTLTKGKNRDRDVLEKPSTLDRYPIARGAEHDTIWALIENFNHYRDNLPYACLPESNAGSYNSNSFARGLQDAAGLATPPLRPQVFAPGWFTPVPRRYFQLGQ